MILKLQHFIFFYSAGEKQKIGVNIMLGSWQGVNGKKKVEPLS